MDLKTGIGYDIHPLAEGRRLYLGGIEIPYIKGLLAHSDGDVLLHAISDALLGAASLGDLGDHFPDTDPQYHNIASCALLKRVNDLLKSNGFTIQNIDAIVIAEEPRLTPFKKQMQQVIAQILNIRPDCVNVKAKTSSGVGETGKKEAIASFAVATLTKGA